VNAIVLSKKPSTDSFCIPKSTSGVLGMSSRVSLRGERRENGRPSVLVGARDRWDLPSRGLSANFFTDDAFW